MSKYLGDVTASQIFDYKFTTVDYSTGAPATLSGTPVLSVYKDNDVAQTTTGVALTVDFDGVTGLNHVKITTTDAFYVTGEDYSVVITTGTVGAVSVVGRNTADFSIQNRYKGISATALSNLEDQFDGTGLSGDTYPATQGQLAGLSVASAAQSVRVKPAPNGFVLTTGAEVNDEDSTVALDGVRHELSDTAGTLDGYYKFDIDPGAVPVSLTIKAVVNGGNDIFGIYANIGSSSVPSWSQRLSITGSGTATNDIYTVDLYSSDTLTDLDTEVWIRIYGTGLTTSAFDIDQMFISRSFNYQYSGYDNGAVWISTSGGTAGTTLGYNGIASRPVDTLADAVTIGNLLSISRFEISNSSSITLASTISNKILAGRGWTLALGGQDITNTHILDAKTSGIGTGSAVEFHDSSLTNVTLPDGSFHDCAIAGTFTCSASGTYHFHQSHSGDGTTPIIDLGAAVGATTLLMHNWKGSIIIDNLGATGADEINLAGDGEITLNASCVGGTLNIQGSWKLTNNGSGITINKDDNTINIAGIQADTNDIQTQIGTAGAGLTDLGGMSTAMKAEAQQEAIDALVAYDPPTNAEMELRTPTAAQLLYLTSNSADGVPVTFSGGTITTAVMVNVDGSAASSIDDYYNGRILIFNAGTLNHQATDITDYDGATKTATITGVTTAVTSSHTANMK